MFVLVTGTLWIAFVQHPKLLRWRNRLVLWRLALHVASLLTRLSTNDIFSSQPGKSTLLVAFLSKVLSVLTPIVFLCIASAVFTRASSSTSSGLHTLSSVVALGPTSDHVTLPSCGLPYYLCERLAKCDSNFAKLDDKFI